MSFTERTVGVPSGAQLFFRIREGPSNDLPLLLLLHGFPQNSTMWDSFVPGIPQEWTVLTVDLPGYGNSIKPPAADGSPEAGRKAAWAADIIAAIDSLYSPTRRFIAYGHDRGGHLAYRLAILHPDRVAGAAALDIVPIAYVWAQMRLDANLHAQTHRSHHWVFLASPRPLPETLISANTRFYYEYLMRNWMGSKARGAGQLQWVESSLSPYTDEDTEKAAARIRAACDDYRAGASLDLEDDLAQGIVPPILESQLSQPADKPIGVPFLVLWSSVHLRRRFAVDDIWASVCPPKYLRSLQVGDDTTGHFFPNEEPEDTLRKTLPWLEEFWSSPNRPNA